jgi:carbon storage regulator
MLILTRRRGETIRIDCDGVIIEVIVVEIKASQARIGVKAPAHVAVDREEIAIRKAKEVAGA